MEKEFLKESYARIEKDTNCNPMNLNEVGVIFSDSDKFKVYKESFLEGLNEKDKTALDVLIDNSRQKFLENTMTQISPYETLTVPILRRFYPRLIAKELVNTMPIDKPDVIKGFMKAHFGKYSDTGTDGTQEYPYEFPYTNEDRWSGNTLTPNEISKGPSAGINVDLETSDTSFDILDALSLNPTLAHLEKDLKITAAIGADATNGTATLSVVADVDGNFSSEVIYDDDTTDVIVGKVDFNNGILYWQSTAGTTASIRFEATASLEENRINSQVNFTIEKIRLTAILRQISGKFTIPFEQDMKALFDLDAQTELINLIGEQIALEIDREIIDDLITGVLNSDSTGRRQAIFDKNPPSDFYWGRREWYSNIQIPLSDLSAEIYNANLMGSGNVIACNPTDSAVLESLNDFRYAGSSVEGGTVDYKEATVVGGKWKILVSSIVPRGKMVVKYRSPEAQRASYVYAPYVPALLTPYPLGYIPSLTIMSRYAKKMIRPESIALLSVVDTGTYHEYGATASS